MINTIAEGWPYRSVIDLERRDLHAALIKDHPLGDIRRLQYGPFWVHALIGDTKPDILRIRLCQVRRHLRGPTRPPYGEWGDPAGRDQPPGHKQIRKADNVVGMEVG